VGLPVLAAQDGEQPAYVTQGIDGMLVDYRSAPRIAAAILELVKWPGRLGRTLLDPAIPDLTAYRQETFSKRLGALFEAAEF